MKRKACIVATTDMTVRAFLVPHLRAMQEAWDVTVAVSTSNPQLLSDLGLRGDLVQLPMARRIAPWHDVVVLIALVRLMRHRRFDIVHSITPKAGLLAMVAAKVAGIPNRIHTFTGQVWVTRTGPLRALLRAADRVIARLATLTLADSRSQREFLVREKIASPTATAVLGHGSVAGVDPSRFKPDAGMRQRIRMECGIAAADLVLLFVGRLTRDKGVLELATAFAALAEKRPDVHLLIVGPDEGQLRPSIAAITGRHANRLHFVEFTDRPEHTMAAADVLCLPSYREGFGSVIVEAAAAGVPAVASRIYGIVDAVEEGRTGLLHRPGDVRDLVACLLRVSEDDVLRKSMGLAARQRAERDFSPPRLTAALLDLYSTVVDGRPWSSRATTESGSSADGAPSAHSTPKPIATRVQAGRERHRVPRYCWYERGGKRVVDLVVAGTCLVTLLPLLAVLASAVGMFLGAPVFFRQVRPGRFGVPFVLVKFRTMTDRYDAVGGQLSDGDRLTPFGRFLRATSLDELPELWNVIRGDMSLVGPRPLLMEYLPLYNEQQARRHDVRPGITGLAQVNGRNDLIWSERFALDVEYVERHSLRLDLEILIRSVWQVISARGISQPGRATVDYFQGNVGLDG